MTVPFQTCNVRQLLLEISYVGRLHGTYHNIICTGIPHPDALLLYRHTGSKRHDTILYYIGTMPINFL